MGHISFKSTPHRCNIFSCRLSFTQPWCGIAYPKTQTLRPKRFCCSSPILRMIPDFSLQRFLICRLSLLLLQNYLQAHLNRSTGAKIHLGCTTPLTYAPLPFPSENLLKTLPKLQVCPPFLFCESISLSLSLRCT
jgi:hypothetical protein